MHGRAGVFIKSPRLLESVRGDANNAGWGGMVDAIEHAAYCDGQREEDDDGNRRDQRRGADAADGDAS